MKNQIIFIQGFKYIIIGLSNTLLTAVIIWILLKYNFGNFIANFTGYLVGILNSRPLKSP
ncbi:MAG: hypothetical protein EOM47_12495 [Bacteroidia bacterium]|nr:hypothetical protein [Bacteroidia bacterium]